MNKFVVGICTILVFSPIFGSLASAQVFTPKINLKWTDGSADETGFAIERGMQQAGPFVEVGTVATNIVAYGDTAITAMTIYCYRVRAWNAAGYSGYSNTTCGNSVPLPDSPSVLLFAATSPAPILQWTDAGPNETGFAIERGALQAGPFTEVATVAANISTYTDTTVAATVAVCYRVRAFNVRTLNLKVEKQYSGYSNVMCRPASAVPPSPRDLLLSAQTEAAVTEQRLTAATSDLATARSAPSYWLRMNKIISAQNKVTAARNSLSRATTKMTEAQQILELKQQ